MKRSFAHTQTHETSPQLKASIRFAQIFLFGIILSSLILTMGRVVNQESRPTSSVLKAQAMIPDTH